MIPGMARLPLFEYLPYAQAAQFQPVSFSTLQIMVVARGASTADRSCRRCVGSSGSSTHRCRCRPRGGRRKGPCCSTLGGLRHSLLVAAAPRTTSGSSGAPGSHGCASHWSRRRSPLRARATAHPPVRLRRQGSLVSPRHRRSRTIACDRWPQSGRRSCRPLPPPTPCHGRWSQRGPPPVRA